MSHPLSLGWESSLVVIRELWGLGLRASSLVSCGLCVRSNVIWGRAEVFQGCFCSHTSNLYCSVCSAGVSSHHCFNFRARVREQTYCQLLWGFLLSNSFSDSLYSLILPSFLEASFQPHLLPCPTNCVDSHTQIQFMVFLTQALLLLLPLFYFLNFFVASFLGRYISRSFVHHLITLQEEVWAVGLWVLLELVCFL